jgi:LysM repeat protein
MVVESKKTAPRNLGLHTVASGESLGLIARKYNMTSRELAEFNGLKGSAIQVGQKLKVAGGAPATLRAGSLRPRLKPAALPPGPSTWWPPVRMWAASPVNMA